MALEKGGWRGSGSKPFLKMQTLALVRATWKATADSFRINRKYKLKDEVLVDPLQNLYLLPSSG